MDFVDVDLLLLDGDVPQKKFVIDQLRDRLVRSAERTLRILAQLQLAELHFERVEEEQPPDQRVALADDQLHRFRRLDRPHHARSTPSTPPSAQLGTVPGSGGSG